MPAPWPRPQQLLPPRLLDALRAANAGKAGEALALVRAEDADDPLARSTARLVRGLALLEQGADAPARRQLRPLLRDTDPALSLAATLGLVDLHINHRRYASAAPLVGRASRHAGADAAAALVLEVMAARLVLLRHGQLAASTATTLHDRLQRQYPAEVHAAVYLLDAEAALADGRLHDAVTAARQSRPYVDSAGSARLRRQHDTLRHLLEASGFADVEDWEQPLRPASRSDVALLERQDWERWIDALHRVVRYRDADGKLATVRFASAPEAWEILALLARAAHQRLGWEAARTVLRLADVETLHERVRQLASRLGDGRLVVNAQHFGLCKARFVHLYVTGAMPRVQQDVLAVLAESGVMRAQELAQRLPGRRRTLLRHLAKLRRDGFVRLLGGGRDASYALV